MSNSGATETSTPLSGGCGGGTISSATNKPVKDDAVDSTPFQVGEKVLAFHGPCLYDAKVQNVEFHMDEWRYYIHYHGWNKHWDEWLSVDCLLKRTEENVQKQKELKEKHSKERIAKPGRPSQDKTKNSVGMKGKKRKHKIIDKEEEEEDCIIVPPERLINIQIPSTLKKQLVDDHECITHLGRLADYRKPLKNYGKQLTRIHLDELLIKLPRSPSVYEILNKYFDYRVKKDGVIAETVVEIVNGLRCYFDKALPAMLLYKHERQQYKEVVADNVSPSSVYGAEHLLRLFVKLPEILSCLHIEMETLTELQQRLMDFLRFLQSNQSAFFQSDYQTSDDSIDPIKEEDN